MQTATPSRTALIAAAFRALHQVRDDGKVFRDPFAEDILGPEAAQVVMGLPMVPGYQMLRFLMAARSRFAADALDQAVRDGCRQLVILGAGFDTFSLRNPYRQLDLRVFEVDHPSTQADKHRRLTRFGPRLPAGLTLVPMVFGTDDLSERLTAASWRADEPTFFQWLGVAVYLDHETALSLLAFAGRLPGSTIVFDYSLSPDRQSPGGQTITEALMRSAADSGEPWIGFFEPKTLAADLQRLGFTAIDDLDLAALRHRYLGDLQPGGDGDAGPHVVVARRT